MKRVLALVALALVASGCTTPHQPEPAAGATSTTPTPVAGTGTPRLPALEPHLTVRHDVPWQRVGPDWHLLMTLAGPHLRQPDHREADEARLQLLSPSGVRTDLVVMDHDVVAESQASKRAWPFPSVEDFSPEDRTVLLLFHDASRDATAVLLDLASGEQRQVRVPMGTAGLMLRDGGFAYLDVRGRLVAADWDGATRVVSRTTGVVLPRADRSGVVAAHPLRVVSLYGSVRRLPDRRSTGGCNPRAWWDAGTVLLTCGGSLWSARLAGGPLRLVARATAEVGVDDAVRLGDDTYLQILEGCGGAWLARAEPDGSTADLSGTHGQRLVGVVGDRLLVQPATPCGTPGVHVGLALLDPAGGESEPFLEVQRDEVVSSVHAWGGLPRRLG
ncbi:hypothetical protein J2X46_001705 [Nocardioides sp. BE266]|uniref:hypothetical protein n=1 Tax=Nocardioides sp. BE266 TaxID=2817725 RepID=UPI00285D9D21|nr:hypothetical protein [Nocardioides sp. BE266]MDR7252729.1 hypothetical protein [Nocardioides sp. BE266]